MRLVAGFGMLLLEITCFYSVQLVQVDEVVIEITDLRRIGGGIRGGWSVGLGGSGISKFISGSIDRMVKSPK